MANNNNNNNNNTGIGLLGLMFLIFMTLKLTDHIDWSWWWVQYLTNGTDSISDFYCDYCTSWKTKEKMIE